METQNIIMLIHVITNFVHFLDFSNLELHFITLDSVLVLQMMVKPDNVAVVINPDTDPDSDWDDSYVMLKVTKVQYFLILERWSFTETNYIELVNAETKKRLVIYNSDDFLFKWIPDGEEYILKIYAKSQFR